MANSTKGVENTGFSGVAKTRENQYPKNQSQFLIEIAKLSIWPLLANESVEQSTHSWNGHECERAVLELEQKVICAHATLHF